MGVASPKFENYVGTGMTSPIEYTAMKAALIATTRYLAKYYKDAKFASIVLVQAAFLTNNQQPSWKSIGLVVMIKGCWIAKI